MFECADEVANDTDEVVTLSMLFAAILLLEVRSPPLNVVVLGGAGGMGRAAARAISKLGAGRIVIADRDRRGAEAVASECGGGASAVEFDVTDPAGLASSLAGSDVVLNCVGPFYRFDVSVLRAAIDAGCRYLDICDDWEPTLGMLALDDEAKRAGVTAIVGMGASPGLSNLLATRVLDEVDEVDELVTGWSIDTENEEISTTPEGNAGAALVHWIRQSSGTIRAYRDGREIDAAPLEKRELDYPGLGRRRAWTVGHPEPLTLPRAFPRVRSSANVMVLSPVIAGALRWLAGQVDAGEMTVQAAADTLLAGDLRPTGELEQIASAVSGPEFPPVFAVVTGRKGGRPVRAAATLAAWPPGGLAAVTGIPLAVGARVLEAHPARAGVLAPEQAFEPDVFFRELAPWCTHPETVAPAGLVKVSFGE